jgi:phosphatidylethanolamine-binding protein (PEBP) family uncharacterized protein
MDDEDARAVQGDTYTHYLAVIPFEAQVNAFSSLAEVTNPSLPYESRQSVAGNNIVVLSDLPPCNPTAAPHNYRWTIYALSSEYNAIPDMKAELDFIINQALSSTTVTQNLNQFQFVGVNQVVGVPRITRSSFENKYGSVIIGSATLVGTM